MLPGEKTAVLPPLLGEGHGLDGAILPGGAVPGSGFGQQSLLTKLADDLGRRLLVHPVHLERIGGRPVGSGGVQDFELDELSKTKRMRHGGRKPFEDAVRE
jgi:hypothetical protein